MRKSLQRLIEEGVRKLESGASIEEVLASHPGRADELRPHFDTWAFLSSLKPPEAPASGVRRVYERLQPELAAGPRTRKGDIQAMDVFYRFSGGALRLAGALAVVAAIVLGITALSGNLSVGFGGSASAIPGDEDDDGVADEGDNCPLVANSDQADADNDGIGNACDPSPTDGLPECFDDADVDNDLDVDVGDVTAIRDAFGSENGDPGYNSDADLDGDNGNIDDGAVNDVDDGDVDVYDVAEGVQLISDCTQQMQP